MSDSPDGNNRINYEIIPNENESIPFYVNPDTGDIIVNGSLDFEGIDEYLFTLLARDNGIPLLNSTTDLTFIVTDENDNAPVLSNSTYFNLAVEDAAVGTVVIDFISAMDVDSPPNNIVQFILTGPNNDYFAINRSTGVIRTARGLDREVIPVFVFFVVAFNEGNILLNDTATVTIEVADINDNPPVFNQTSYSVDVSENVAIGDVVLTVLATDSDERHDRNITYRYKVGSSIFSLDSNTGQIRAEVDLALMKTSWKRW